MATSYFLSSKVRTPGYIKVRQILISTKGHHAAVTQRQHVHATLTLATTTEKHTLPEKEHTIMAINSAISASATILQLELDGDMMHGLGRVCEKYGGKPVTQGGLKCLQAIPIVHAAQAVKESEEMSATTRNSAMSKCMQEISVPGGIKVLEEAETEGLRFSPDFRERLYYTLRTGVCVPMAYRGSSGVMLGGTYCC